MNDIATYTATPPECGNADSAAPAVRSSMEVRTQLVDLLRRDLIGPLPVNIEPADADLARERLSENPSRWYLAGFLAPAEGSEHAEVDASTVEEQENFVDLEDRGGPDGVPGDEDPPEQPNTPRRLFPSSIGLTVLLPEHVTAVEARVSWGDYVTEPPLSEDVLTAEEPFDAPQEDDGSAGRKRAALPRVEWIRKPHERMVPVPITNGKTQVIVPNSAALQRSGGGLFLTGHGKLLDIEQPDGTRERVRAVTIFLVNRRSTVRRRYADLSYAFQARLELFCPQGFRPRHDLSGYKASDDDLRIADLHYRDVCEFAVGRNSAAAWVEDDMGRVDRVWTDPLPKAEVERVAPNEDPALTLAVTFGMEALANLSDQSGSALAQALEDLPQLYDIWIATERNKRLGLAPRRLETANTLIKLMEKARGRLDEGIDLLRKDERARLAFRIMNLAVARAARRRNAGTSGDPMAQPAPTWRPFQLAFILVNLKGLTDKQHPDREIVDLLFFPTGGGKTEAYLGLAAYTIAHRRLSGSGLLGAGVSVIMRYTLRLLTLDQLSRAAGVICALELMRTDAAFADAQGRPLLGDWPIEIGLWVGSDASPNRLGGKGNTGDDTAVTRVRAFRSKGGKAPAPIKACPWCGKDFDRNSFACTPNEQGPTNLEIRCTNASCDFTRGRALPVITVDEVIYRRLPAFLIATVDKFAGLPWLGESGSFFGHVDRYDPAIGFFGANEPASGRPLDNGWQLDPPDLVIQDELHLISGPLGTVAGLYETAIDQLATRTTGGNRIRPKIVASTATVRRAHLQIQALFDRNDTQVFPPPGINRTDSFFARTVPATKDPARLYVGLAAQGRGPKLVFLRALTTLVAAGQAAFDAAASLTSTSQRNPADPYMTAVCYFNALRELGGARRIVEDEVRDRASRYGSERRRLDPPTQPFSNRRLREPMELTSRVSTDEVAKAKARLERAFGQSEETVDVALATNMISVGLDITRLGLMLVQGQPKTAAEYIQASSRVGRDHTRPGIVLTILNLHKPRDRTHFEQFGHFHRTFYRSVEATSVTPWAARALDRALAAVIVALIRHLDGSLTPERAVLDLRNRPDTRQRVRDIILVRAKPLMTPAAHKNLELQIDALLDGWIRVADAQRSNGVAFAYGAGRNKLLHVPLDLAIPNLDPDHQRFIAGRSMRDVEPSVRLNVRDPYGNTIANAADLS